jgi:hypothetical protein
MPDGLHTDEKRQPAVFSLRRFTLSLSEPIEVLLPDVPHQALPLMADQLRGFGVKVDFEDHARGAGSCIAGRFEFTHRESELHIKVTQDHGHFPRLMLIGGIRQFVREACELVQREQC